MFLELTKKFGKPICVALYAAFAALAVKKTKIPLIVLAATHLIEYFVIGMKVAKEKGVGIAEGFINCLCFGFCWWLPLKNSEDK